MLPVFMRKKTGTHFHFCVGREKFVLAHAKKNACPSGRNIPFKQSMILTHKQKSLLRKNHFLSRDYYFYLISFSN